MKGKKVASIIIIILVLLLGGVNYAKNAMENNLEALSKEKLRSFDMSKVRDGIFRGSSSVLPVSATVEVTIENNRITSITLLKHFNGRGSRGESVVNSVLEQQDVTVDIVAGATYSSMVILKAVEAALFEAAKTQ